MVPPIVALQHRWSQLPPNLRGALWLVFAGFVLISMNSIVKTMGSRLPAAELLFFRGAFGIVFLIPLVLWRGWRSVATRYPWMHLLRTCFGTASMFAVFYSVTHMPLADATAILFSSPLFATVFAAVILREAVGWRRATATLAGFAGILVMMRPGAEAFDPVALVAVAGALMTGALAIIIRRLSGKDSPYIIIFWFTTVGSLIALPFALAVWVPPLASDWPLLVLIGFLGLIGQTAFTFAFSTGEFERGRAVRLRAADLRRAVRLSVLRRAARRMEPDRCGHHHGQHLLHHAPRGAARARTARRGASRTSRTGSLGGCSLARRGLRSPVDNAPATAIHGLRAAYGPLFD